MVQASEFEEFVNWCSQRYYRRNGTYPAPNTLRARVSRLSTACTVAHVVGIEQLGTLLQDRRQTENLLDGLSGRMTTGSVRAVCNALKWFGEFAVSKGWITHSTLMTSDFPPGNPHPPIVIYTDKDTELILGNARAKGLRWWMFLNTLVHTGRRVGEVLGLEWEWLDLAAETPNFHLPHTKNGRQAYVPLSRVLREEVLTPANIALLQGDAQRAANRHFARDPDTYPFPWRYSSAEQTFKLYCKRIGVEPRGFHCLRHTKATNLLARGVPIQAVSSLLGHASVSTTDRIYNHANALSYSRYID